jgi:meso-butanediol dehydrogenase/(S,S)-butanediol dehydrogenase/diacetyl reductase
MGRLEGKIALISGTGGGQGRAAAILFAKEGARVFGCDLNAEGADATVELARRGGGEMISRAPVDLSVEDQAQRWVDEAVEAFGGVDIVYNNAGAARPGPLASISTAAWR